MNSGWDVNTINNYVQDAIWIVCLFFWFWKIRKDKKLGISAMTLGNKLIGFGLVAGLVISSVSLYFNYHPRIVEKTVTVDEPYKFKFLNIENGPKTQVFGKHFEDERVILDGTSYQRCTFKNVTFVYNGTGPVGFANNDVQGFGVSSENPAVISTVKLLYGLGLSTLKPFDLRQNQPVPNVEPPTKRR
jgi:hypothetical protein